MRAESDVCVRAGCNRGASLWRGTSFSLTSYIGLQLVPCVVGWCVEPEEGTVGLGAHALPGLQQAH